jgi:bifunctional non-homologous end joining protein LigD
MTEEREVRLTSADRVLWPGEGITKGDLFDYYREIAPVLVPISRRYGFDQTYEFAELVARGLEAEHPGLLTTQWLKEKRRGVLVDHRQNGWGKTIASAYSARPRPGAPVSTPLRWRELTPELDFTAFTMDAVLERVRRKGDLFEPVLHGRQALGPALRSLQKQSGAQ